MSATFNDTGTTAETREPAGGSVSVSASAPLRVLIVDDEPLALERLRLMLREHANVEVVGEATDGDDAAGKVASHRPDLVLLDIRMPSRDGISLARSLADKPEVGVVFVTAFDEFAVQAFEVDAVDYLLKPVSPDRLRMALIRATRHAERVRSGAPLQDVSQVEPSAVETVSA